MERSGIHVLTDRVQHMIKCLECSICLNTLVAPVITRCVHIFCERCIGRIVEKKGAKCPLCKESLTRRSILRAEQVELCVEKLHKLLSAIEVETGIDVVSCPTVPSHSKECNTPAKVDRPGGSTRVESTLARARESIPQTSGRLQGEHCKMPPQSSSNRNQNIDVYLEQPSTSKDSRFGIPFNASVDADSDKTIMILEETETATESTKNYETRGGETTNRPDKSTGSRRESRTSRSETSSLSATSVAHDHCDPSGSIRASSDKLSGSKQNWSQVKMFGKEMRRKKRKKKMSALDISIESGKRTAEKATEVAGENNPARSRPSWELEQQSTNNSGRNESNMPESSKGALMPDSELLWSSERLPNIENTYPRASSTPKNTREVATSLNSSHKSTTSDTLPLPGSPFVTLQEGTQVRIRSLNDHQMKDILGITQSISPDEKDKPLKKRSTPYQGIDRRPLGRSDRISQQKSPLTQDSMQSDKPGDLRTPSSARKRDKPLVIETQLLPSLELSTTPRAALSSKERKNDIPDTRSSHSRQDSPRLSTVKRDLSKEITHIVETTAPASTRSVPVAFKKLGKMTFQGRAKPCKFLYLGSCRRATKTSIAISSYVLNSLKPCNTAERRPPEVSCNLSQTQDNSEKGVEVTFTTTMVAGGNNEESLSSIDSNETIKVCSSKRVEAISEAESISHDNEEIGNQPSGRESMRPNVTADSVTARVQLQESMDVDFESVIEPTAQKTPPPKVAVNKKSGNQTSRLETSMAKKPTLINGVKMLSPEKDSQLRFLSTDSPMAENVQLLRHQGSTINSCGNNSFNPSEVKGAHSRELIRRSQQSNSENTESDVSNASKKRKRSSNTGAASQSGKESNNGKGAEAEACVDSDTSTESLFSMATQKKPKSQRNVIKSSTEKSQSSHRIVSHSSDTDVINDSEEPLRKKKTYKRIRRASSSSGDSVEVIGVESKNRLLAKDSSRQLNLPSMNRPFLPDVDVNINIAEIAESWCTDAYARGLYTKKRGTNHQTVSSSLTRGNSQSIKGKSLAEPNKPSASGVSNLPRTLSTGNDISSSAKDLFDSAPYSVEKQADYASAKTREIQDDADVVVEENDEFNSIIDRVRQMQKGESNRAANDADATRKGSQKRDESASDLLHDNFNDIMANVDTALLMGNATLSPKNADKYTDSAVVSSHKSAEKTNYRKTPEGRSSRTDVMSPRSSCASDKENRDYQRFHNVSSFGKRKNDRERSPVKSDRISTLCKTPRSTTSSSPSKLSVRSPAEINKKACENYNQLSNEIVQDIARDSSPAARETSSEQDSLMNITQHQLLLQQFEEDLFNPGRAQTSPKTPKSQSSRTSGQKDPESTGRKKNPNQDPSSSVSKDTECSSAEEDDIVESTPETKTKTSTSSNSGTRRSVHTPALRSIHELSPSNEAPSARKATDSTAAVNAKRAITLMQQSTRIVPHIPITRPSTRGYAETSSGSSVVGNIRTLCFVCSSLGSIQIKRTRELAGLLAAHYTNQFHPEVTHVIVKADHETNTADKTLKYLQGVAHKKWVIGYKWVEECLRQKQLVDEEPYEVLDSYTFEAGPRNSRLRQSELFEDFAFLCYGPYVNITTEQYKDLLHATGGEIVETLEALAASARKYRIIVIQPDKYEDQIMAWYRKARAVPIADDWIVECISQYKLISLYTHLQELLPQDVLALGYPEFLIEEDVEGDDNMDVSEA